MIVDIAEQLSGSRIISVWPSMFMIVDVAGQLSGSRIISVWPSYVYDCWHSRAVIGRQDCFMFDHDIFTFQLMDVFNRWHNRATGYQRQRVRQQGWRWRNSHCWVHSLACLSLPKTTWVGCYLTVGWGGGIRLIMSLSPSLTLAHNSSSALLLPFPFSLYGCLPFCLPSPLPSLSFSLSLSLSLSASLPSVCLSPTSIPTPISLSLFLALALKRSNQHLVKSFK